MILSSVAPISLTSRGDTQQTLSRTFVRTGDPDRGRRFTSPGARPTNPRSTPCPLPARRRSHALGASTRGLRLHAPIRIGWPGRREAAIGRPTRPAGTGDRGFGMGRVIAAAAYSAAEGSRHWHRREQSMGGAPRPLRLDRHRGPRRGDLRQLQVQFGLHELAIEDALHAHQRPKLETYGKPPSSCCVPPFSSRTTSPLGETEIFVGRGYVISVRHGGSASYARVRHAPKRPPSSWPTARTTSSTP